MKDDFFRIHKNSSLTKINIQYGNEVFKFNLLNQLNISEKNIERELKDQPTYYGFCLMLQKKLTTHYEQLRQDRKKLFGKLFLLAKEGKKGSNGRGYSDDAAKAYVACHPKYVTITQKCIAAKDSADVMWAIVRAFEQRKDLLQTISSNKRKEF